MQSTMDGVHLASLRLQNALAAAGCVAVSCYAFSLIPFHHEALLGSYGPPSHSVNGREFLVAAALAYVALLIVFFLTEASPGVSKALRAVRFVGRLLASPGRTLRQGISPDDGLALRIILLKGFFGPFMAVALMRFCMEAWAEATRMLAVGLPDGSLRALFDYAGFWFLLHVILFVDVLVFTVGYLVELPRLRNQIKSVDPSWLGWAAAMVCYPPFNSVMGALLFSPVTDFPQFEDTTLHLSLNLALLLLMAIYASASVALGLKASNLTHRGIVARGPYAVVRHPAYVCKNLAWWIGSIPLISAGFSASFADGLVPTLAMAGWSAIYVLRALTEEDHLRKVDGDYAAYAEKVRYRFIPGIA